MAASPPRQTEIRIKLPGNCFYLPFPLFSPLMLYLYPIYSQYFTGSFQKQFHIALDAFSSFGFPPIPQAIQDVIEVLFAFIYLL
jgi:hypothetical protein